MYVYIKYDPIALREYFSHASWTVVGIDNVSCRTAPSDHVTSNFAERLSDNVTTNVV